MERARRAGHERGEAVGNRLAERGGARATHCAIAVRIDALHRAAHFFRADDVARLERHVLELARADGAVAIDVEAVECEVQLRQRFARRGEVRPEVVPPRVLVLHPDPRAGALLELFERVSAPHGTDVALALALLPEAIRRTPQLAQLAQLGDDPELRRESGEVATSLHPAPALARSDLTAPRRANI